MWEDESVQNRVATDWYKEVRRVDESLIAIVEGLQQGDEMVNRATLDKLKLLAQNRRDLKPIQKAQERFGKGNAGGPAPFFYADAVLRAVEIGIQSGAKATYDGIIEAVLGLRQDDQKPSVQSLEAVGAAPAFPRQMKPTHDLSNFIDVDQLLFSYGASQGGSTPFRALVGASSDAAIPVGAGVGAREFPSIPAQFQLRFTDVDGQPAHVHNAAQKSLVQIGTEVAFPSLLEASGVDDLFTEGAIDFVGFEEGSIIVTFVVNMVQSKTSIPPAELFVRVQQSLRAMTPETLQALMPGLTLDAEFTRVKQLTPAELAGLVRQERPADSLFAVATENVSLRSALIRMARPLREQRNQLVAENRKHRRVLRQLDLSSACTGVESDEEFNGYSDAEDADFWVTPTQPRPKQFKRQPLPVPSKATADVESVTSPMKTISLTTKQKSTRKSHTVHKSTGVIKSSFRMDVPETPHNLYASVE